MSRRSRCKYPNLTPNMNLKRRQELIDYDYLDKLSDTEKEWLNKFTGEYVGASFPKESVERDGVIYKRHSKKHLHKKNRTKEVYDSNNARNRDIYIKKASTGGMEFFDEVTLDDLREKTLESDNNLFEDVIIELDYYIKNPEEYKEKIISYLNSLNNSKIMQKSGMTERGEYIKFLIESGFEWVLKS